VRRPAVLGEQSELGAPPARTARGTGGSAPAAAPERISAASGEHLRPSRRAELGRRARRERGADFLGVRWYCGRLRQHPRSTPAAGSAELGVGLYGRISRRSFFSMREAGRPGEWRRRRGSLERPRHARRTIFSAPEPRAWASQHELAAGTGPAGAIAHRRREPVLSRSASTGRLAGSTAGSSVVRGRRRQAPAAHRGERLGPARPDNGGERPRASRNGRPRSPPPALQVVSSSNADPHQQLGTRASRETARPTEAVEAGPKGFCARFLDRKSTGDFPSRRRASLVSCAQC